MYNECFTLLTFVVWIFLENDTFKDLFIHSTISHPTTKQYRTNIPVNLEEIRDQFSDWTIMNQNLNAKRKWNCTGMSNVECRMRKSNFLHSVWVRVLILVLVQCVCVCVCFLSSIIGSLLSSFRSVCFVWFLRIYFWWFIIRSITIMMPMPNGGMII